MYILRSIIFSNAINTVEPPIIMDTLGSGILSFKERLSSLRRLKCISIIFGTLKCVLYREVINPRRACAARVTVLGPSVCLSVCLSVSVSMTILALQAMKGHQSDTNSSSATSDPKLKRRFC